jgi:hypothetical protein
MKRLYKKIIINCKIRNAKNQLMYLDMDMQTGCYTFKEYEKEYNILVRYLKKVENEKIIFNKQKPA